MAGATGTSAEASGPWLGEREWGGRLLQGRWHATVWWYVEIIDDVGQVAQDLSVGAVVGGPLDKT